MSPRGAHQLAEYVAALSSAESEEVAIRTGVARAAEALDAPVAALVRDGRILEAVGWPPGTLPTSAVKDVAASGRGDLELPGAGATVPAVALELEGDGSTLVLARAGGPLDPGELTLARGMTRTLALTLRLLRTVEAERFQAERNAVLVGSLRRRQRLLEAQSTIQRAIARRAPLREVLDRIVASAEDILGDELPALFLRDPDDPGLLHLAAHRGIPADVAEEILHRRVGEGVAGRAVAEGRLCVAEDYVHAAGTLQTFVRRGLSAAMAAPIIEDGEPVGALLVSTYEAGRRYSRAERETLESLARHASLALIDARTVAAMSHQALHDALTGLPNRALFLDRLEHARARANRAGGDIAVLFCDLDRFKNVNDSLGHGAGDELLVEVAARLGSCLRDADTAARFGGDEFAILLEDLDRGDEAERVAQRILEALRAPIVLGAREVPTAVSIGIAVDRAATGSTGDDLLRHADLAMYRAKALGRGRAVVYEPAMQAEAIARLELEADLGRALERDELEVHYQPIVDLRHRTLVGCEALVRWRHPERGLVGPDQFIGVAEETGSIVALGAHVLRVATQQAAAWRRLLPRGIAPRMSVNLSGRQLADEGLVADVARALQDAGLEPSALVLEITETTLMTDTEGARRTLDELKRLGVRLAVDDFGTGWSSLRYLRQFPIDVLKMAKPFVDGLGAGPGAMDGALAGAIVDLGANLGLTIVAEGIEQAVQAERLRALGCALGQGWYFHRAVPACELEAILAGQPADLPWRVSARPPALAGS